VFRLWSDALKELRRRGVTGRPMARLPFMANYSSLNGSVLS
jgi:hypothetical protein